jgi:hypothetical protein
MDWSYKRPAFRRHISGHTGNRDRKNEKVLYDYTKTAGDESDGKGFTEKDKTVGKTGREMITVQPTAETQRTQRRNF